MSVTLEAAFASLYQAIRVVVARYDEDPDIRLEKPRETGHGDVSTNVALLLARSANRPSREIAESIAAAVELPGDLVSSVDVAGPGFINFTFSPVFLIRGLREILRCGTEFGRLRDGEGKRAQVEFVSANPTGPLTIGHGRQAVLGDAIARILENASYDVHREYYFNDAGRQMRLLGESIRAQYVRLSGGESEVPEGGYQGGYVEDIARSFMADRGGSVDSIPTDEFTDYGRDVMFAGIRRTLDKLRIRFDRYYSEQSLYDSGRIEAVIDALRSKGLAYQRDGALWLDGGKLDLDQDWVMVRQTGEPTYRLPDIAYHVHKLELGFDLIVDVFGADHQATYPVVLAAIRGLDRDISAIQVLIHQFVTVRRGGREVRMSKRAGDFYTLDDLIDEVGADAVRFFYLLRVRNSHLAFDIDLALKQSDENPVFYIQYAHARTAGILRHAREQQFFEEKDAVLDSLIEPEELSLIRELLAFPDVMRQSLAAFEPQKLTSYLRDVAAAFHQFYQHHRVISDDRVLSLARLSLVHACRTVLGRGLEILGVGTPDRM